MLIKKRSDVLMYFLIMMLLTGCWDNVPIEERGFVVGSALDKKDGKVNGNYELTLTNQFVIPPGVHTNASGGGGSEKAFTNLSVNGESIYAMDTDMATLTSKIPFFEHLKLLVISEDLISTPHLFANTFDVFVRDKEMRRGVHVVIAEGEAKKVLEVKPEGKKLPAIYIVDLLEESLKKTSLFKPVYIGDIHEHLLTNSSFAIPKVKPSENVVKYEGAVVYHGFEDKVVGSLTMDEVAGLNFIRTKGMHGGTVEFKYEGHLITFRIYNEKTKVKIDAKDPENLKIHVDIGVEGGVAEVFGNKSLENPKNVAGIEKAAAKRVEELVNKTVEKAQKELNAEIFGFDEKIRQRHYDAWQKIKDDWDQGENYFAKSDIQVTAKAKIRTAGATDKTESDEEE